MFSKRLYELELQYGDLISVKFTFDKAEDICVFLKKIDSWNYQLLWLKKQQSFSYSSSWYGEILMKAEETKDI